MADHSLLHNIFCHKLCLFCKALVSIKTWYISCHIDIHRHFIKLLQDLISIVDFFPCSNVWPRAKKKFMFVACVQTMGRKCCKTNYKCKRPNKNIVYFGEDHVFTSLSTDHQLVLWAQVQIDIMATNYPNASSFIAYLEDH